MDFYVQGQIYSVIIFLELLSSFKTNVKRCRLLVALSSHQACFRGFHM